MKVAVAPPEQFDAKHYDVSCELADIICYVSEVSTCRVLTDAQAVAISSFVDM